MTSQVLSILLAKTHLICACNEYLHYAVFSRSVRLVCDRAQYELESNFVFSRVLRLQTNHLTNYWSSELTELKPNWKKHFIIWKGYLLLLEKTRKLSAWYLPLRANCLLGGKIQITAFPLRRAPYPGDDVLLYFLKRKLKATYNYRYYSFHHGIEFPWPVDSTCTLLKTFPANCDLDYTTS
jgi:hypothetical protein